MLRLSNTSEVAAHGHNAVAILLLALVITIALEPA